MRKTRSILFGLCLTSMSLSAYGEDFYARNDINIVVGLSAGGAFDTYARLLARHMGRHIPGNPRIIVQNMPGAGSLTAVRHLDAIAPTDGTVIVAFNPGLVLAGLVDYENVPVDFRDYAWLGSIARSVRVCYTWHTTGIATWDDLVARDEVVVGGTAPGTGAYMDAALIKNVFDVNVRPVLGFPGAAEYDFALERGEVDVNCNLWSGINDTWKGGDEFVPLVRMADILDPQMPDDLPFLGDLAQTDEQHEILDVIFASHVIGVPYVLSRQVPEERLEILREAFDATMRDPAFLAEAEQMSYPVIEPLPGGEAEIVIEELYGADPDLVERVRLAVEME